jgi:Ca2+-binding RTX toxin-like protein
MAIIGGTPWGDTLNGTSSADIINGQGGDDHLYGLGGDDYLVGGPGADWLDGGAGTDVVSYAGAGAGVTADLKGWLPGTGDAQGDHFVGIENLSGSPFNDSLLGDQNANELWGNAGNDNLYGGGGLASDVLHGNDGNDHLSGDGGADILYGGAGADTFVYNYNLNGAGGDVIKDFSSEQGDRIEMRFFDTGSLTFVGSNAFTGLGQVHYLIKDGNTYVEANTTGDNHADFSIELTGVHQLHASDFIL